MASRAMFAHHFQPPFNSGGRFGWHTHKGTTKQSCGNDKLANQTQNK
jgi:hypothetical protein